MLRDALQCAPRNWPIEVYTQDTYKPPLPGLIMVMAPDLIREIMVERPKEFPLSHILRRVLGPVWRNGLLIAQDEDWRWQRKAAAPVFTPKAALDVVPFVPGASASLIAALRNGEVSDITPWAARAVTDVVFSSFVQMTGDADARRAFSQQADVLSEELFAINPADLFNLPGWTRPLLGKTARRPSHALHQIVGGLLKKRERRNSGALTDLLANSRDPDTQQMMSADLLRDNVVGYLAAARETTALAIAWVLWVLARDQALQDEIVVEAETLWDAETLTAEAVTEMPRLTAVIYEVLRLFPPLPQNLRVVAQTTELAGMKLRKGTHLVIPIYAIHRHHGIWDNPDDFDPDRFMPGGVDLRAQRFGYIPFGIGPRVCIGQVMAMYEIKAAVASVLREVRLSPKEDHWPDLRVGATLRSGNGLPVVGEPRA